MIDRTTFDLRIAEHTATTARINGGDWQRGKRKHRAIRATLAAALVSLAARLDPARHAPERQVSEPATA
jgi:hypothetical protein